MLPEAPISFGEIFTNSVKKFFKVYKNIFLYILILVVIKDWYIYVGRLPQQGTWQYIVELIMSILIGYMIFSGLYATKLVLINNSCSIPTVLANVFKPALKAYIACIFYSLLFVLLIILAHYLGQFASGSAQRKQEMMALTLFFVAAVPFFIFAIVTFFAIPLIILENSPVFAAFSNSIRLLWGKTWARVFGLYFIMIIIMLLVDVQSRLGQFLKSHYLNGPFDFVILSIGLPILFSLIVYSVNDLRIRKNNRNLV